MSSQEHEPVETWLRLLELRGRHPMLVFLAAGYLIRERRFPAAKGYGSPYGTLLSDMWSGISAVYNKFDGRMQTPEARLAAARAYRDAFWAEESRQRQRLEITG